MIVGAAIVLGCVLAFPPAAADALERAWRALHDANDPRAALAQLDAIPALESESAWALRVELLRLAARSRLGEDDAVRERALALRSRAAGSPVLALELAELLDATAPTDDAVAADASLIPSSAAPSRGTFGEPCPTDADRMRSSADEASVEDAPTESDLDEPWVAPTFTPPLEVSVEAWNAALDAHAHAWAEALERFEGEPSTVVALLGRRAALDLGLDEDDAYELATFSFVHGTRRALPEVRNTWELQHGNTPGRIHVRMTANQLHALARCDDATWPPRLDATARALPTDERAAVEPGEVFVERVAWTDARSEAFFVAFQVLALDEPDVLVLRWERVDDAARRDAYAAWFSSSR